MVDWEITGTNIKDSWYRIGQAADNGMKNNSTPFDVAKYDRQIKGTLPFYEEMFQQVVDIEGSENIIFMMADEGRII